MEGRLLCERGGGEGREDRGRVDVARERARIGEGSCVSVEGGKVKLKNLWCCVLVL